ncbi:hypothetical protein Q0Z83_022410 [Actinoplanes sichuanensis]|uniref:CAAX prenyl protease-like protein n=1 Tax=Actinoplanes sichuanensis TaxID=512349 RepID=A0ABW4AKH0_9ACTN|nr:hypothetical protein [Actinoplanes sichuanensis]BEL04050.1 hypothetical protein Q0Z83_022410 [Actinoplanes sichuanensis]
MTTESRTIGRLLRQRSVQITAALWVLGSATVFLLAADGLPIQRGHHPETASGAVISGQINLVLPLILVAVTLALTRRRPRIDLAQRSPEPTVARRETYTLIGYGVLVGIGGLMIGKLAGEHAYSLHLPGTIYGLHGETLHAGWVAGWVAYNLIGFAVIPYLVFRRRGYTTTQLSLRSSDRRGDAVLIVVILAIETVAELGGLSSAIFDLSARDLLIGIPLAFTVNFFGTVLPIMIFIYAILLPRFARLTGSPATTAILGGVAYAVIHVFESWAVYDTADAAVLTVILLFLQYLGPGIIKAVLTQRTGNAWVHVWAYHAIAPHVTIDTVNLLDSLRLR